MGMKLPLNATPVSQPNHHLLPTPFVNQPLATPLFTPHSREGIISVKLHHTEEIIVVKTRRTLETVFEELHASVAHPPHIETPVSFTEQKEFRILWARPIVHHLLQTPSLSRTCHQGPREQVTAPREAALSVRTTPSPRTKRELSLLIAAAVQSAPSPPTSKVRSLQQVALTTLSYSHAAPAYPLRW